MKTWILLAICFIFSVSVMAHEHGGMKDCHNQMKELCKDVKRGPELFKCMEENKSKLSADCQQKIEDKKEKWKNKADACKEDRKKLCSDIKPGEGRIRDCMKAKVAELSAECKTHFEKIKADVHAE